jgi:hypothetical protein
MQPVLDHHRAISCSTYAAPRRYPVVIAKSSTNSRESHNAQRIVISPLHFPCQHQRRQRQVSHHSLSPSLVVRPELPRPLSRGGFPLDAAVALGAVRQVSPSTSGGHACGVRSAPALPLPGSRPVLARGGPTCQPVPGWRWRGRTAGNAVGAAPRRAARRSASETGRRHARRV